MNYLAPVNAKPEPSDHDARPSPFSGLNGRIGQDAARAFLAAGWQVTGFGRTDRVRIPGVTFIAGDAEVSADVARAIAPSDVVLDAVNLPYDKWDKGRYEKSLRRPARRPQGQWQDAALSRQYLQLRGRRPMC